MNHSPKLAVLAFAFAGLAGCNSIGDGSTIEKLEIVPALGAAQIVPFEQGGTYKLLQCMRDELVALATFTNGTRVNFSNRTTWSSSDAAVVQVSNGDIPAVLVTGNPVDDGSFYESSSVNYVPGTVVPLGTPGQSAVVTARFASLSASINLEIRKPTLSIVAAPDAVPSFTSPIYLGAGTQQRLTMLAQVGGRTVSATALAGGVTNSFNINPLRWIFTAGTFDPADDAVSGDVDRWVIEDGSGRVATLHPTSTDGVVTAVRADYLPHQVAVESSLCPGSADPALRPVADVQVATFYDDPGTPADDRFTLSREAGFSGSGFAVEDMVMGTDQKLELRGKLDANGDGSQIVEQNLETQGAYLVQPLDQNCTDSSARLGCTANEAFSPGTSTLVIAKTTATEGDESRITACHPLCLAPLATLAVDDAAPGLGAAVNFTATAVNPPAGATVNYVFDFGDGATLGPQASPVASHAYTVAGAYTATVRLVDAAFAAEFLSQNAGAVRVVAGGAGIPGNTAPTAALAVSTTSGDAPLNVLLNAGTSADADAGDGVTVYEFDPADGTPVIRQTSSSLVHTYADGTAGPFTPTVRVYDQSGAASAPASDEAVTVNGVSPAFIRSNSLLLRARDATLCSVEIQPTPAATPTEAAFTFPGLRFEALGSFVADTATDACTDPVIGTQRVTRFMLWLARPAGVTDEFSSIAQVVNEARDFQSFGHVEYLADVAADTTLDITAIPQTPFNGASIEPTPSTLTVTPCPACTP